MEVYAIDVRSWTASFRYPNLISGVQPTLEVPPISTVLGLINAAAGRYIDHQKIRIGYYLEYAAKATDLETLYMVQSRNGDPSNNAKANVIKREFLFDVFLRIYVEDEAMARYFENPVYPLVLGRMNDLAYADARRLKNKISLVPVENADRVRGQIVPFTGNHLPGVIQALPKYFTNTIPRRNLGTEPYSVLGCRSDVRAGIRAFRDIVNGRELDVFFHDIDFTLF